MSENEFKSPITVKEEEIDLGGIFKMIGKAITKLFNLILIALKTAFHYFIVLLLFVKNHLKKIVFTFLIGAIIGFIVDYTEPTTYTYDMIIQPNYGSIHQIYENMEYYNVLVAARDTITLAEKFNISYEEAKNIKSFTLSPYETEKDQILAYDEFLKKTDSLTHRHFEFKDFKGTGTSKFDSKTYVYRVRAKIDNLSSLEKTIIEDVEKNPTLQQRKRISLRTIEIDSTITTQSLKDLTELRKIYKDLTLSELETEKGQKTPTNYIDFSKESSESNENLKLFEISKNISEQLMFIETKKEISENIINIITTFNPAGKRLGTLFDTKMFRFSTTLVSLLIAIILLINLNRYLVRYKEEYL